MRGANDFQKIFGDLKFLKFLRNCWNVAEFVDVVLDNTKTHLKNYVFEHPALGTVMSFFLNAYSNHELVPCIIRKS